MHNGSASTCFKCIDFYYDYESRKYVKIKTISVQAGGKFSGIIIKMNNWPRGSSTNTIHSYFILWYPQVKDFFFKKNSCRNFVILKWLWNRILIHGQLAWLRRRLSQNQSRNRWIFPLYKIIVPQETQDGNF